MVISSSRKGGHIHIHKIEHKSQIKYLGVFIDQNLHWGPQIIIIIIIIINIFIAQIPYEYDQMRVTNIHYTN